MKFSIVIPIKDKSDKLKKCLESIDKYTRNYEIILDTSAGFAHSINEGIRKSKGDYIILLHDDCTVTKGWTDKLATVGAFKVGECSDAFEDWGAFYPGTYCTDPTLNPDYSFFLCLSRKVLKKIGKFDEWYKSPWCQDVDMGLQIKSKGLKIECLEGKIIHYPPLQHTHNDSQREHLNKKWGV